MSRRWPATLGATLGATQPPLESMMIQADETSIAQARAAQYSNVDDVRSLPTHLYPPVNWENIDLMTYVSLPAIGAGDTVVISFTVPLGRHGIINKVAANFVGGGWVEGSGDLLWRILVDGAPPPGATSYASVPASLGSPANPVGISGFRIFENQVLTLVVNNNPLGPGGGVVVAGQKVGGRLMGYLYPKELEDESVWI